MLNGKVSLMTSNQQFVKSFLTGISLAVMPVAGMNANAETLDEALTYTYVANPSLAAQRAYVKSVYEQINESKSGYKPTIAGQASYGYLYQRQRSRPGFSENESMPVNMGVNAVQPLFSGFGTVASVKAARHKFESEKAKLQDLEQSVLTQAVVAYTDVIRAIAVWKLNQNNEAVLKRQLDYTRDRFRVGELTKTDVAQAEARYAGAVASRIQAEGNVKVAYASYQETIGKMPDKIFEPEVPAAKLPQTLEDALAVADKNNPSVISAEYQEKQAKSGVDVAKSAYYPSLNLQASYLNSRANAHGSAPVYDASGAYQGTMQTGAPAKKIRLSSWCWTFRSIRRELFRPKWRKPNWRKDKLLWALFPFAARSNRLRRRRGKIINRLWRGCRLCRNRCARPNWLWTASVMKNRRERARFWMC